jgi:hypothetical protein
MSKIIPLIAILLQFLVYSLSAEVPNLPKRLKRISTSKIEVQEGDSNTLYFPMEFNGAVPKSKLEKVKALDIASISLVYSRYRLSETFDQLTLNAQRMDKLYACMPGLKGNLNIQWNWVEQTGCEDPNTCKDYFHGFVIKLKSKAEMISSETELALMDYYTSVYEGGSDSKKMDSLIAIGKVSYCKVCDTIKMRKINRRNKMSSFKGWNEENKNKLAKYLRNELKDSSSYTLELLMHKNGEIYFADSSETPHRIKKILHLLNEDLKHSPARYNGKKIETRISLYVSQEASGLDIETILIPILPKGKSFNLDSFLYQRRTDIVCDYVDSSGKSIAKTTGIANTPDLIFKVFDRNTQWKNCLIATDVTGSMYPYLAQFKVWHKLHLNINSQNNDFIFFNDGDNMPDNLKVTGQVGGLYYVHTSCFSALSSTMNMAMSSGGGGDGPENNLEAVLKGLQSNPEIKEVIMIADNNATPRDLALLYKIKVPIRLILCGAQFGINTDYLEMIRINGGSIHTMEDDLYTLSKLNNGEKIIIDGIEYEMKYGKFLKRTKTIAASPGSTPATTLR